MPLHDLHTRLATASHLHPRTISATHIMIHAMLFPRLHTKTMGILRRRLPESLQSAQAHDASA